MNKNEGLWLEYGALHSNSPDPASGAKVDYYERNSKFMRGQVNREKSLSSIVVVAFNEAILLPRALASLDLALSAVEEGKRPRVLVVDNCSTDATGEVAKFYGAEVINERKKGIGYARQAGLLATKDGESDILTTDADAVVPEYWIVRLLQLLNKPDAVFAYGRVKPKTDMKLPLLKQLEYSAYRALGFPVKTLRDFFRPEYIPYSSNLGFKREQALFHGGYDSALAHGEDYDLMEKLKNEGRVVFDRQLTVLTSNRRSLGNNFFYRGYKALTSNLSWMLHHDDGMKGYHYTDFRP